jgi:hypothetical protein
MGVYLPREQDFGSFAEPRWDEIREERFSNLVFDSLASGRCRPPLAGVHYFNDPLGGSKRDGQQTRIHHNFFAPN